MAEWQARVDKMIAERAARKQAKLVERTAALMRKAARHTAKVAIAWTHQQGPAQIGNDRSSP